MSKHKVYTLYIIVGVTMLLAACTMPAKQQTVGNKARHQFTNEVLLGYTPVKNQGRNPLCWAYLKGTERSVYKTLCPKIG